SRHRTLNYSIVFHASEYSAQLDFKGVAVGLLAAGAKSKMGVFLPLLRMMVDSKRDAVRGLKRTYCPYISGYGPEVSASKRMYLAAASVYVSDSGRVLSPNYGFNLSVRGRELKDVLPMQVVIGAHRGLEKQARDVVNVRNVLDGWLLHYFRGR